jgi:hypothetical protein
MRIKNIAILLIIIILSLGACNDQSASTTPSVEEPIRQTTTTSPQQDLTSNESAYPLEQEQTTAYPITENAYPINEEDLPKKGPKFTIDEPVSSDNKSVTGTGPAEVPIRLVDVSAMGKELATTTIEDDGTFKFELGEELIAGHLIGLMIGDLSNTSFNYDEFMYSDEYIDKPMIGTLFDMVLVPEDN